MKLTLTIKLIIVTVACFVIALFSWKMTNEEQLNTFADNINQYFNKKVGHSSKRIEKEFSLGSASEVEIESTSVDVVIEKSKDELVHISYAERVTEEGVSKTDVNPLIENGIMKLNLDRFASGDTDVQFNMQGKGNNFGLTVNNSNVRIQIPEGIAKLKIKTVGGDIKIENQTLAELLVSSISGDVKVKKSSADILQQASISGNFKAQGKFKNLKTKTVSGDVKLVSELAAPVIKATTTSGEVKIAFTESPDIFVGFTTTSGEIKIEVGAQSSKVEGSLKGFKIGNGTSSVEVETTSGDVKIVRD